MMRSQRKATPLIALFGFELAALFGLHLLGSSPQMQVDWNDLSGWLANSTIEEIVTPLIRLAALVVAYWMFVSTLLFTLAQLSRIPAAIRATSMLTVPSVRRLVDGAVAVSIASSSIVGLGSTAAMAAPNPNNSIAIQTDLGVVDSPTTAPTTAANNQQAGTTTTSGAPTTTTGAPTTTTTSEAPTTTTSAAPSNNLPVAPGPGDDFVNSPRPSGVPAPTAPPSTQAPGTSTTTQAPKVETPSTAPAPGTQVAGVQEHKVVKGDNLWTISRDALASTTNRAPQDVSEAEIREYWLKVIDENRDNIRSGDPHWIFPGEVITLPAA